MSCTEITGDLFSAGTQAIAHGVNCKGLMGAGIAAEFARRYPRMKQAYIKRCELGLMKPSSFFFWAGDQPLIYNLATQMMPGRDARLTWIERSVDNMLTHAVSCGIQSIAMPRIGCGIGGLNWEDVQPQLKELGDMHPVDLIVCSL